MTYIERQRGRSRRRREVTIALLLAAIVAACGDGDGPSGPGENDDPSPPTRFEVVVPDSAVDGRTFELSVTARTASSSVATDFTGTVALSVSAGSITPASLALSGGTGAAEVRITGPLGELTVTARSGGIEGSTSLSLLFAADQLEGQPSDPAAEAIPAIDYQPVPEDFFDDHPEMTGLPVTRDILLLSFHLGTTVGEANEVLQRMEVTIIGGLPGADGRAPGVLVLRTRTETHESMEALLAELEQDPVVEVAVQDAALSADVVTRPNGGTPTGWTWDNVPAGGNWGLERIRVPQLWNLNPGVRKAIDNGEVQATGTLVIDAGFAPSHPDLAYVNLTPMEVDDHGTHVAGIIGALHDNEKGIDGLNPFARMTVTDWGGVSSKKQVSWASMALGAVSVLVGDPTIRVVNTSLGYNWYLAKIDSDASVYAQNFASSGGTLFSNMQKSLALARPLPVWLTAAGNDGGKNATFSSPMANAALEQGDQNIIVVESVRNNSSAPGGATRSSFSNINGHLSAPGSAILSTGDSADVNSYSVKSGTSMATPHVAGLVGYLYTLDPSLPDPSFTSNPMRDLLTRTAVAVGGGAAPRIDAYAAVHEAGDVRALEMLTDLDDGTPDGNLRWDPETETDFTEPDDDGDGGRGDGQVDMADFRRWRDGYLYLLDPPGLTLDGAADHPKKDLNGDGEVFRFNEFVHPFLDLNGDTLVDLTSTAQVAGAVDARVTDLQVLQQLFDDPHYDAADLDNLIVSADLAIRPENLEGTGPDQIWSSVTAPDDNTPWEERLHSGLEADGEGLHQVYTVPVTTAGEEWTARVWALDAAGDTLFEVERSFAVHPGEDHFWDPAKGGDILFRDTSHHLWVIQDDGSNPLQITSGQDRYRYARWSPDGEMIAGLVQLTCDAGGGIGVLNADGSGARLVLQEPCGLPSYVFPEWYPDGSALIAYRDGASGDCRPEDALVRVELASGSTSTILTSGGGVCLGTHLDWAEDGSRLILWGWPEDGAENYLLYEWTGGDKPVLLSGLGSDIWAPRLSRDGARVAFYRFVNEFDPSEMELVVSDLAGAAPQVLVSGISLGGVSFNDAQIAWSPDDDRLVFTGVVDTQAGLFVVGADGSGLRLLRGGGFSPDWR